MSWWNRAAAVAAVAAVVAPAAVAQDLKECKTCGKGLGGGTGNIAKYYSGYPYCGLCYEVAREAANKEAEARKAAQPVKECLACRATIDDRRPHVVIYGGGVSNFFCNNDCANRVFSCARCRGSLSKGFQRVESFEVDGGRYCKACAEVVRREKGDAIVAGMAAPPPPAASAPAEVPRPSRLPGFVVVMALAAVVGGGIIFAARRSER